MVKSLTFFWTHLERKGGFSIFFFHSCERKTFFQQTITLDKNWGFSIFESTSWQMVVNTGKSTLHGANAGGLLPGDRPHDAWDTYAFFFSTLFTVCLNCNF